MLNKNTQSVKKCDPNQKQQFRYEKCEQVTKSIILVKTCYKLSLSTLVLNSRDWSEIVWLPEISRFKINLAIGFIRKNPTGMHWLGYNDAVSWLNKAKTRIFQPTANFEIFKIYLYFVCLPASQPASLP